MTEDPIHVRVAEAMTERVDNNRWHGLRRDLFYSYVEFRPGSCWLWQGGLDIGGYGFFRIKGRPHQAHRVAYMLSRGAIPAGLQLDHLCRERRCVNPVHLEAVSQWENIRHGTSFSAKHAVKTHCLRGHPLSGPNLIAAPRKRECRSCRQMRDRRRGRRRGDLILALSEAGKLQPLQKGDERP